MTEIIARRSLRVRKVVNGCTNFLQKTEKRFMADLLNLFMLVCAALGSMAFGVLAAYGIFRVAFGIMRPQRRPVAVEASPESAGIL